ncbi:unnamed protein product [Caretta caretta]
MVREAGAAQRPRWLIGWRRASEFKGTRHHLASSLLPIPSLSARPPGPMFPRGLAESKLSRETLPRLVS